MSHEQIETEVVGRVGIIRHNRPEKMNALSPIMALERERQIAEWNQDPGIGAIVVTGNGRGFCAGADVGGWKKDIVDKAPGEARGQDRSQRDPRGWTRFCMESKPLIAAVNGATIGAGLSGILPFDVRVACPEATLSMRFIRIGIFPELGSTHILPHIVGMGHAMELMLTGKTIDGVEAGRIGLVNHVVPKDKLMEKAMEIAEQIAFNPLGHAMGVKEVTWQNLDESELAEVQRREGAWLRKATSSAEFKEAVNAFLEKRTPDFHKNQ